MSPQATPWRRRLSELGRGVGKPHAPLFAPLLFSAAAQIEALPPAQWAADATKLAKGVSELRRILGTSLLVTAVPSAMEAEALGASVSRAADAPASQARVTAGVGAGVVATGEFDDLWPRSAHLQASLEATRRLAAAADDQPVILPALTGAATLLAQLFGAEPAAHPPEAQDFAGRALAALVRAYAQAGASAVALVERQPPGGEAWRAALGTVGNVARFHRIPLLLVFEDVAAPSWPGGVVACPPPGPELQAQTRPCGAAIPPDPAAWEALAGGIGAARIAISAGEAATAASVDALRSACEAALAIEREAA